MKGNKLPHFSFWQILTLILGAALLVLLISNKNLLTQIAGNFLPLESIKQQSSQVKTITPAELKQKLSQKDFFFINVHTPYEGEIAKTDAFIKFDEIEKNQAQLPKDKEAKIILYCQTGRMSETAAKKLLSLGYTNVSHLAGGMEVWRKSGEKTFNVEELKKVVLPEKGFSLPITWGDLGPKLVSLGVIDLEKFKTAVKPTEDQLTILTKNSNQPIAINGQNSQFVVDLLWALGLAQKSKVYTDGPMGKDYKDKVGNFASTGGWTLGKSQATNYLNRYEIVKLTPEQQNRVFEISKNVYRPCCGNPTSFPDCNHGMAALALVELLVAQNYSDEEIYKMILGFNSFWFSQTYIALGAYFAQQGITWDKVEAKKVLSQEFSSGQGAGKISQQIGRLPYLYGSQGGSCGA